ncbi:MAG: hypothetical protein CL949_17640 [Erythrobacter sp.]|nr:hypothetical protein [Erythrobacter sp.]
MADTEPTIEEMRAQKDELERRLAAASLGAAEAFVALLASEEVDALMTAMSATVEPLDAATRKRVAAWVKMRGDMATLAKLELARLRGLAAVADTESAGNGG